MIRPTDATEPPGPSTSGTVDISFIVPAHNEELLLPATLAAIRASATEAGASFEMIVADDGSTDATGRIAAEHGAVVVRHERRQIAATRNMGAAVATGDVLIFVDADTTINAVVLRQTLEAVRQGAVGGGALIRLDGWAPMHARVLLAVFLVGFRIARLCGGAYLFCRRDAFLRTGGWDETLYASEEITMAKALKRQGRFVIVRDIVITSGRKLRTYSGTEFLAMFAKMAMRGRRATRQREGLELWYGPRRTDPGPAPRPRQ